MNTTVDAQTQQTRVGVLWLAFNGEHVAHVVRQALAALNLSLLERGPQRLSVALAEGDLALLADYFAAGRCRLELDHTVALLLPQGVAFAPEYLHQVQPLSHLLARLDGEWLVDLLAEERLTTLFQPIVYPHNPLKVYGYECLTRGLDGDARFLPPLRLFDTARRGDLMFELDRLCRTTALRNAHAQQLDLPLFINFNPSAIYEPRFCLASTLALVKDCGWLPEKLCFEVVDSDHIDDQNHLSNISQYLREQGFKIALDDLGAGYESLSLLTRIQPDFVKFDAQLVRDVDRDPYKAVLMTNLIKLARDLGIKVIAEGVERGEEWRWLLQHGVDFMQGHLFGRPQPVPMAPEVPISAEAPSVAH